MADLLSDSPILVVGLGNPEPRYARTPHNLGFLVLDELQRRWAVSRRSDRKVRAEIADTRRGGKRIWLMAPLTYMNRSGDAVQPFCSYHDIAPTNTIVVCDDHDLPWGRVRLRPSGSTAGHKGLKSIGERFATNDYPRLRIGIRPANQRSDLVDYVLATFHGEARDLADPMTALAADTVEAAIDEGIDAAMSRFNGVNLADDNDEA